MYMYVYTRHGPIAACTLRIIRLGALSSEDDAIYRNRQRRDCLAGLYADE